MATGKATVAEAVEELEVEVEVALGAKSQSEEQEAARSPVIQTCKVNAIDVGILMAPSFTGLGQPYPFVRKERLR